MVSWRYSTSVHRVLCAPETDPPRPGSLL